MRLNQIDVPGRAAATRNDNRAPFINLQRMLREVFIAPLAMSRAPVARINAHGTPAPVNHRVNEKRRRDETRHALAFFMHSIAVEQAYGDARAPAPALEIKREHVRRFDGFGRGKARTDALAPARESREVMKTNRARENDVRVFRERAIDFDGCTKLRLA